MQGAFIEGECMKNNQTDNQVVVNGSGVAPGKGGFSSKLGFVLAAAGSAVGLGNIWRFPYLAANHGGGVFILTYVILALTFGFVLMTAEIALGRKT